MSRRLFDFLCKEKHLQEHFVSYEVTEVSCEICSKPALKQISAPTIKLEPYSGIFVSAADKWARKRAEKLKQEQKQQA
jgi:hypothetical protein